MAPHLHTGDARLPEDPSRKGPPPLDEELIRASAAELAPLARSLRARRHARRVTFAPVVHVPLGAPSREGCGHHALPRLPEPSDRPFVSTGEVLGLAREGAAAGRHGVLLCLDGHAERGDRRAGAWLKANGYATSLDYLRAVASLVLEETGLVPHLSTGPLDEEELAALRSVSVSQATTLERLDAGLVTLEAAGRLQIPFTARILVGADDDRAGRLALLRAVAASHAAHGHVQEILLQGLLPEPAPAWDATFADTEELAWTIAAARLVLAPEVHVQAPPRRFEDVAMLVQAGADDLGCTPPRTIDRVDPERAQPAPGSPGTLEAGVEAAGGVLAPRLPVHPEWALVPDRWIDERLRFAVLDHSDAEGLARDSTWIAGGETLPPVLVGGHSPSSPPRGRGEGLGRIGEILAAARAGEPPGEDELVALFAARGGEVAAIAEVADELRAEAVGDTVTFVANRNINYTNVCTFKCRFCAFSKGPLSLNLRGAPYLLDLEEITRRVVEAEGLGATEVCLQGGIHPRFDGEYYVEVLKAVRAGSERIHIHGFSALEVTEGARRLGEDLESYLRRLYNAGLRSLPGTAAEILDDDIRAVLCPGKLSSEEWLETHRVAHRVGLRSNVTIMFGAVEEPRHWARHLTRTREVQRETGGFTEFVPLPFVHMATPLYLQHRSRRGPTFREVLLVHAVGRIAYHGLIPNVQASWVKTGVEGLRQLLQAGCNDAGGTLVDESIAHAAGASPVPMMTPEKFREAIEPLGRPVEQRTTVYGRPGVPA